MNKLSILIPSNRPEGLERFLDSLKRTTRDMSRIEVVVLVDDDEHPKHVQYHTDRVEIHNKSATVLSVAQLQWECYRVCTGDWIMLGNDDVIMETPFWDDILWKEAEKFPDEIALFYPNDGMFGERLACFPIISRKVIDITGVFPMTYRRYKVDDTIFQMFPAERRVYMPDVMLRHLNDQGTDGYKLEDGRVYPIDRLAASFDNELWARETGRRVQQQMKVLNLLNDYSSIMNTKVCVGISTMEVARKASFYDYLNTLARPESSIMTFVHGQSPARARNMIVDLALEQNCTHVFFVDDDIELPPNALLELLKHDKDMVTALYTQRNYPHFPILFRTRNPDNSCNIFIPTEEEKGLVKVVNAGLGCCLIKIDVFKKMQKPWVTLGEYDKDMWCDDVSFFNRAHDAGFELYCDLDVAVKHQCYVTVHTQRVNGHWTTLYDSNGTSNVAFPMPRP